MAKADKAMPQPMTRHLDLNRSWLSPVIEVSPFFRKRDSVVWERAARIESKLDIAAAKMPAKIRPLRPSGSSVTIQIG